MKISKNPIPQKANCPKRNLQNYHNKIELEYQLPSLILPAILIKILPFIRLGRPVLTIYSASSIDFIGY